MTRAQRVQRQRKQERGAVLEVSKFGKTHPATMKPAGSSDPGKFPYLAIGPELVPRAVGR